MISKSEAILRLKKMGVVVAQDQSIVTVLLPEKVSFSSGIKDIKEKLKSIGYDASFCVKQSKAEDMDGSMTPIVETLNEEEQGDGEDAVTEEMNLVVGDMEEIVTDEELSGSLISMDDDGQFTLGDFGLDF